MAFKNIFKLFLIVILVMGNLNFAYADGAPIIGPNQAKHVVQNYLDSHNLPYTAITPTEWEFFVYVKDTKTGEKKWISNTIKNADDPEIGGGPGQYESIPSTLDDVYGLWIWIVHVKEDNEKNVGQIYVYDGNSNKVLKVIIHDKVLKDIMLDEILKQGYQISGESSETNKNTSTLTNTNQNSPESDDSGSTDNTWMILATSVVAIALGVGYWKFNGR